MPEPFKSRIPVQERTILTLTTFGVPEQPEPKGGNGYAIGRMYMTLDGVPVNPSSVVLRHPSGHGPDRATLRRRRGAIDG